MSFSTAPFIPVANNNERHKSDKADTETLTLSHWLYGLQLDLWCAQHNKLYLFHEHALETV